MYKEGDDYIMLEWAGIGESGREYCKNLGLYEGCICKYVKLIEPHTVRLYNSGVEFEVGGGFFIDYFKRSYRSENLKYLLDDE